MASKRQRVKRTYDASARRAAAELKRATILEAAHQCFVEQGFARTTMAEIARTAGVAIDTLYASVGTKHVLFRALIESAISGVDHAVPAEERDYVIAIRKEPAAERKLVLYAAAVRRVQQRLAPLFRVVAAAAPAEPELAELWKSIADRRAANMRLLAKDLAATGALGISIDEAADILWAMNGSELYSLLVDQRGWTGERFEGWLGESWQRLLLRPR